MKRGKAAMNYKNEIIKAIESMSGRYSPYNIFSDWVEMCALSIMNAVDVTRSASVEEQYGMELI